MSDGLKVGDMFVINGVATCVLKIAKKKNLEGEEVLFVFYGPYFNEAPGRDIVRSIPIDNFGVVSHRRLISKQRAQEVLERLAKQEVFEEPMDADEASGIVERNNIDEKVRMVKQLWWEKKNKKSALPYSKSRVFRRALEHIFEELAIVLGMEPEEVEEQVMDYLTQKG